mgnify:CR=1 FL=1
MENIGINEIVTAGIILLFLSGKVMKLAGWEKGILIADELRDGLEEAREFIVAARVEGNLCNIDRAAETAAAHVKGLDSKDVRPVIEGLVSRASHSSNGISVSIDGNGDLKVDPTGAISKLAGKAGKWLRKVF